MFHKKIDQHIDQALKEQGIDSPMSLQKKIISNIKSGNDCIFISGEKTGKTTALVVAIVQMLKSALNDVPRALVVVQDKDKAEEMKLMFDEIGKNTDLRVHCVYPGPNILKLRDQVYYGSDVVIGTAKRLNELYSYSGLNLNDLQMIIVDDANLTIKIELVGQIDRLTEIIPSAQKIIAAPKMNERVERFAEFHMPKPQLIQE